MKQFSEVLHGLRTSAGLSYRELSNALGVSEFALRDSWEAGKSEPTVPNLRKIAYFFGVDVDELLDMKGYIDFQDAEWEANRNADKHV